MPPRLLFIQVGRCLPFGPLVEQVVRDRECATSQTPVYVEPAQLDLAEIPAVDGVREHAGMETGRRQAACVGHVQEERGRLPTVLGPPGKCGSDAGGGARSSKLVFFGSDDAGVGG